MIHTVSDFLDMSAVRAVLTVSESDLPDETLSEYGLEDDIGQLLDEALPGWVSMDDDMQERLMRLYVKYQSASIVAATAPVFVLKKETDGNNEGQRSDKEGFLWMSEVFAGKAAGYLARLQGVMGTSVNVSTISLVSRLIPGRDPITQARGTVQ